MKRGKSAKENSSPDTIFKSEVDKKSIWVLESEWISLPSSSFPLLRELLRKGRRIATSFRDRRTGIHSWLAPGSVMCGSAKKGKALQFSIDPEEGRKIGYRAGHEIGIYNRKEASPFRMYITWGSATTARGRGRDRGRRKTPSFNTNSPAKVD